MERSLPTPEAVLGDPAASDWLKAALLSALKRDRVDAVNDAELLAAVLDERLRELIRVSDGDYLKP